MSQHPERERRVRLSLKGTQITEADWERLKDLSQLQELDLSETNVTDADLKHLNWLTQLETLTLEGTMVTAKGVERLRQALPDCKIATPSPQELLPDADDLVLGGFDPDSDVSIGGDIDLIEADASLQPSSSDNAVGESLELDEDDLLLPTPLEIPTPLENEPVIALDEPNPSPTAESPATPSPSASPEPALPAAWNPQTLGWLGLLFGPVWLAVMAAVNARRLKMRTAIWITIAVIAGGATVYGTLCKFRLDFYLLDLIVYLATAGLLGFICFERQAKPFAAHRNSGGPEAGWRVPILAGSPFALLVVAFFFLSHPLLSTAPPQPLAAPQPVAPPEKPLPLEPYEVCSRFVHAVWLEQARQYAKPNLWPVLAAHFQRRTTSDEKSRFIKDDITLGIDREGTTESDGAHFRKGEIWHSIDYTWHLETPNSAATIRGTFHLSNDHGNWKVVEWRCHSLDNKPMKEDRYLGNEAGDVSYEEFLQQLPAIIVGFELPKAEHAAAWWQNMREGPHAWNWGIGIPIGILVGLLALGVYAFIEKQGVHFVSLLLRILLVFTGLLILLTFTSPEESKVVKDFRAALTPKMQDTLESKTVAYRDYIVCSTVTVSCTSEEGHLYDKVIAVGALGKVFVFCKIPDATSGQLYMAQELELGKPSAGADKATDADLARIKDYTQLKKLEIWGRLVTDAGMENLKGLTRLQELDFGGCAGVTDAGLQHVKQLTQLQKLRLGIQTTDAGLEHVKGLTQLKDLDLSDTKVTDAGLQHLKGSTQLTKLDLRKTNVTYDRVQDLRHALPNCRIDRSPMTIVRIDGKLIDLRNVKDSPELRKLTLDEVTDAGPEDLKRFTHLEELDCGGAKLSDAALEKIAGSTQLKKLTLGWNAAVTDAGLQHLMRLTRLEELHLGNVRVTALSLKAIGGLTELRKLSLRSPDKEGGLRHLKQLARLEELSFSDASDAGLADLSELTQLQSLSVRACLGLTDAGLERVKDLKNLRTLVLSGDAVMFHVPMKITDDGLKHVRGLNQLEELDLSSTRVTDAGLKHLHELPQLRRLNLSHQVKVTGAGLEQLKGATQLQALSLAGTGITDAGLRTLAGLNRLEELNLGGTCITDAGLEHLQGLKQLRSLNLWRTLISDIGLERLKGLKQLKELALSDSLVTAKGVEQLKESLPNCNISSAPNELRLSSLPITDAALRHIQGRTELQTLDLSETSVSDAGLECLKGLKNLKNLDLDSTLVTEEGVKTLKAALPNCEIRSSANAFSMNLRYEHAPNARWKHLEGLTRLYTLTLYCVTNADLKHITPLKQLKTLYLSDSPDVTDAGLEHLGGLTQLQELRLDGRSLTDAGLACLKELTQLKKLELGGTKVTEEGVRKLQEALPNCKISK